MTSKWSTTSSWWCSSSPSSGIPLSKRCINRCSCTSLAAISAGVNPTSDVADGLRWRPVGDPERVDSSATEPDLSLRGSSEKMLWYVLDPLRARPFTATAEFLRAGVAGRGDTASCEEVCESGMTIGGARGAEGEPDMIVVSGCELFIDGFAAVGKASDVDDLPKNRPMFPRVLAPVVADRLLVPVVSDGLSSCPPSAPAGTAMVLERFRLASVVLSVEP